MKKYVDGKKYDTETAQYIGAWDNGLLPNDFDYAREELYRKRSGAYFIYGEGGARTCYAKREGNNFWCGSWNIIPMGYKDAKKWAEEHLPADTYEKYFGEVEEDDGGRITVTLSLSTEAATIAKREAEKTGMSLSGWVEAKILGI